MSPCSSLQLRSATSSSFSSASSAAAGTHGPCLHHLAAQVPHRCRRERASPQLSSPATSREPLRSAHRGHHGRASLRPSSPVTSREPARSSPPSPWTRKPAPMVAGDLPGTQFDGRGLDLGGLIFDLEQRNSILRTGRLDLMGEGRLGERCEVKRREGAQDPDEEETLDSCVSSGPGSRRTAA